MSTVQLPTGMDLMVLEPQSRVIHQKSEKADMTVAEPLFAVQDFKSTLERDVAESPAEQRLDKLLKGSADLEQLILDDLHRSLTDLIEALAWHYATAAVSTHPADMPHATGTRPIRCIFHRVERNFSTSSLCKETHQPVLVANVPGLGVSAVLPGAPHLKSSPGAQEVEKKRQYVMAGAPNIMWEAVAG